MWSALASRDHPTHSFKVQLKGTEQRFTREKLHYRIGLPQVVDAWREPLILNGDAHPNVGWPRELRCELREPNRSLGQHLERVPVCAGHRLEQGDSTERPRLAAQARPAADKAVVSSGCAALQPTGWRDLLRSPRASRAPPRAADIATALARRTACLPLERHPRRENVYSSARSPPDPRRATSSGLGVLYPPGGRDGPWRHALPNRSLPPTCSRPSGRRTCRTWWRFPTPISAR